MSSSKDRFGDTMREKEKAEEDQYFAKQDREKLEKLKDDSSASIVARGMCPRCGIALVQQDHHGVKIDACTSCAGIWLERGELERIEQRDDELWPTTWFRSILDNALPKKV